VPRRRGGSTSPGGPFGTARPAGAVGCVGRGPHRPRLEERLSDYTEDRFAGRTAVVTGGGSGIGRATAVRLAREGARVVTSDISKERLDELLGEFPGLPLVAVAGDIAFEDHVLELVAAAEERIDVLVNNVGIMDGFLPPAELDDATWERVLAVNLTATMRTTRAVLPVMLAAGRGAIVNVSSAAGFRASAKSRRPRSRGSPPTTPATSTA
jgi:NAD(P)-dependent dehydrogenase (short-subunit alcohol dehydrogenase family)